MRLRRSLAYRPRLERFEMRCLLNGSAVVHSLVPACATHHPVQPHRPHAADNFQRLQVNTGNTPAGTYIFAIVTVTNGTSRTFKADDHFRVAVRGESVPILKAGQVWSPGEQITFFHVYRGQALPPDFQFFLGGNAQPAHSRSHLNKPYPQFVASVTPQNGTNYTLFRGAAGYEVVQS